jgi:serine/threonine protein kinase
MLENNENSARDETTRQQLGYQDSRSSGSIFRHHLVAGLNAHGEGDNNSNTGVDSQQGIPILQDPIAGEDCNSSVRITVGAPKEVLPHTPTSDQSETTNNFPGAESTLFPRPSVLIAYNTAASPSQVTAEDLQVGSRHSSSEIPPHSGPAPFASLSRTPTPNSEWITAVTEMRALFQEQLRDLSEPVKDGQPQSHTLEGNGVGVESKTLVRIGELALRGVSIAEAVRFRSPVGDPQKNSFCKEPGTAPAAQRKERKPTSAEESIARVAHWQSKSVGGAGGPGRGRSLAGGDPIADGASLVDRRNVSFLDQSVEEPFQSLSRHTSLDSLSRQPVAEGQLTQTTIDDAGFTNINQYSIMEEIGRGMFGKVYLAVDLADNSSVAIKVMDCSVKVPKHRFGATIRHAPNDNPLAVTRKASDESQDSDTLVRREVGIMKLLNHKNIVMLKEVIHDEEEELVYMVMQYVDNGPIAKVSEDGTCGRLTVEQVRSFLRQAATGLQYLHNHKIIHRDIKPENILYSSEGVCCLADFGVSAVVRDGHSVDFAAGTQTFFSPEMCRGRAEEVQRFAKESDIWALGVTFYAVRFGRLPFFSTNVLDLCDKIQNSPLTFPDDECPADDPLRELLSRMLAKDPKDRITLSDLRKDPYLKSDQRDSDTLANSGPSLSGDDRDAPIVLVDFANAIRRASRRSIFVPSSASAAGGRSRRTSRMPGSSPPSEPPFPNQLTPAEKVQVDAFVGSVCETGGSTPPSLTQGLEPEAPTDDATFTVTPKSVAANLSPARMVQLLKTAGK